MCLVDNLLLNQKLFHHNSLWCCAQKCFHGNAQNIVNIFVCSLSRISSSIYHLSIALSREHTPSLKQLIPGSEGPLLETCFFLHFSLRLSGNNCSRVISMGNFGPTASNLRYEILTNFWVKITALVRPHLWS